MKHRSLHGKLIPLALLLCCLFCARLSAERDISFSGYAGVKGDFYADPAQEDFDPAFALQGYFGGQLNIAPAFLLRLEFSIQTDDVTEQSPFSDGGIASHFFIDELSATYIKPFLNITQYFSLFLGSFEPIGNDIFLQRHFGIEPISSHITESWLGLRGSTAYPFYGAGGSYIVHLNKKPIATGAYLYVNDENWEDKNQLNLDWRFATVYPYLALDFAIGLGAPMSHKQGNEDVIVLIDSLYLHSGINLLVGNKYSTSLFVQSGFSNLQLKAGETRYEIASKDLYLLVEPRFVTKNFQTHITMFSVPVETVEKLLFVTDTFGFNIAVFTDNLYIKNKNITFGFHTTWSFGEDAQGRRRYLTDLKHIADLVKDTEHFNVKITPFVDIPIAGGQVHTMLQATVTNLSADTWKDHFKLSVGYKGRI